MDHEAPHHAQPYRDPGPSAERSELADRVLRRAKSHHRTTRFLSGEPDIADFAIGFHAHQTIEHSLVAVLVHAGEPPPRTHALDRIVALLAERGLIAPPPLMTAGWLNPWAVKARYEDIEPALDQPRALETATLAIDWATRLISPSDGRDPDQAARSDMLPLPPGWDRTVDGQPMPDIVAGADRTVSHRNTDRLDDVIGSVRGGGAGRARDTSTAFSPFARWACSSVVLQDLPRPAGSVRLRSPAAD